MASPLKIVNARIVDGTGRAPLSDGVVVADEQGDLVYAGPAQGAPGTDEGIRVVDVAGRTVLPGFIDCHVHFGMESGQELSTRFAADPTVETFRTAERLRRTLHAGVTTARDLGGLPGRVPYLGGRGPDRGPPAAHRRTDHRTHRRARRLHALPRGIDVSGGVGEIADTADEVRKAVRRLLRDGADVIKLCATGGMGSPHDQPEDEGLTEDEIRTVVDEVRRHGGRPVAAHAQGTAGILNAIRGGRHQHRARVRPRRGSA